MKAPKLYGNIILHCNNIKEVNYVRKDNIIGDFQSDVFLKLTPVPNFPMSIFSEFYTYDFLFKKLRGLGKF